MATYQVHINERTSAGKGFLAFMQTIPDIVTFEHAQKKQRKNQLYKSLDSGFRDVREILDGKQKEVTLKEFLDEL